MTNFKPSELPVDTVIEDSEDGYYTKEPDGSGKSFWGPMAYHCTDCADDYTVSDAEADEKFKDFKIIALPIAVINSLIDDIVYEIERDWQGTVPIDRDEILRDAIKAAGEKSNGKA